MLSNRFSPSSSSSLRTSCVFLNTNSWKRIATIAPPKGTAPYNQIHLIPSPPTLNNYVKQVPIAIAGFKTAPLDVNLVGGKSPLAAIYEAATMKHVIAFSLENTVFSSVCVK